MNKPKVFISATSDLRSARDLAAKALISLGFEATWQDVEPTEHGELLSVLRKRIDPCSLVVQIVGHRYGAEPIQATSKFGRCSYTQYEALYAESVRKKVIYIWLPAEYPVDDAESEPEDLSELQSAYRLGIELRNVIRHPADTPQDLEARILRLSPDIRSIRVAAERRARRLTGLSVAGVVLSLAILTLVAMQWQSIRDIADESAWLDRALDEAGISADDISSQDFDIDVRSYSVMGPNRAQLIVKTTAKLAPIVARGALEVRIADGQWRMAMHNPLAEDYMVLLGEEDYDRGPPVQIRIDSQVGPGEDKVIGPFDFDIDVGDLLRSRSESNINNGASSWLVRHRGRWQVQGKFFLENARAIRAVHIGHSKDDMTRFPIPSEEDPSEMMDVPGAQFLEDMVGNTVSIGIFTTRLQQSIQRLFPGALLYSQFEKPDGSLTELVEHQIVDKPGNELEVLEARLHAIGGGGDYLAFAEAQAAARILSGNWFVADRRRNTIHLGNLGSARKYLRAIHIGPTLDELQFRLEVVQQPTARIDPWIVDFRDADTFPVLPNWSDVAIRLELLDGNTDIFRHVSVTNPSDQSIIRELKPISDMETDAAPLVFVSLSSVNRKPDLLVLSPPGTVRVIASNGGHYSALRDGIFWERHGFEFPGDVLSSAVLRLIFQQEDGSEIGPFEYDASEVKNLRRYASIGRFKLGRRDYVRAIRVKYAEGVETAKQRERAFSFATRGSNYPIDEAPDQSAVVVFAYVGPRSENHWAAVTEVKVGTVMENLDHTVAIQYEAVMSRNYRGWSATLSPSTTKAFVSFELFNGEVLPPIEVPIVDVDAGPRHLPIPVQTRDKGRGL